MKGTTRWLLFADRGGVAEALAARLRARGNPCEVVAWSAERDAAGLRHRLEAASASGRESAAHAVADLSGLDRRAGERATTEHVAQQAKSLALNAVELLQALSGSSLRSTATYFVTRGAAPVGSAAPEPVQATLWGIARTAMAEAPNLGCVIVDLDPRGRVDDDARLLEQELLAASGEPQIAYRDGARYVARLARVEATEGTTARAPSGTYVITGGLGGVGLAVASWLAQRGVERLVLLGRSGAKPEHAHALRALEARVAVTVATVDVADEAALARVLAEARGLGPPLRGVMHAAGVLDDAVLLNQSPERFERVLRPKVQGAWNLHRLTLDDALESFVLFSSLAAVLGNAGQANYAAANTFLDALAHYRQREGLPAMSINWGWWADTGLAAQPLNTAVEPMAIERALAALEQAPALGRTQLAVFAVDWQRMAERLGAGRTSPFLEEVLGEFARAATGTDAPKTELESELTRVPAAGRLERLIALLRKELSALQRAAPSSIEASTRFQDLGMDSLGSLALSKRLRKLLPSVQLVPTIIYQFPSVRDLAEELSSRLVPEPAREAEGPSSDATNKGKNLLDELAEVSDEEIERRFAERLAREATR